MKQLFLILKGGINNFDKYLKWTYQLITTRAFPLNFQMKKSLVKVKVEKQKYNNIKYKQWL